MISCMAIWFDFSKAPETFSAPEFSSYSLEGNDANEKELKQLKIPFLNQINRLNHTKSEQWLVLSSYRQDDNSLREFCRVLNFNLMAYITCFSGRAADLPWNSI